MTIDAESSKKYLGLVDHKAGLVDRRIFIDQDIYDLEMEHIFARAWLFMAHDSMIPNPGDFFMTFMGEDRVIVVRDNDGRPQVLVNSCRHRGNAVCRAEEGHATSFMCTYHGWTYDLKGALVGVPGFKEVYHEELDRESWGLIKAGKVETFKGFIFATMDVEAPPLDDYLGDVGRLCLSHLTVSGPKRIVGGIQKYTIPCNWKFAADNAWDFYHGITSHVSAYLTAKWRSTERELDRRGRYTERHLVFPGEYGHVRGGPARVAARNPNLAEELPRLEKWRQKAEALEEMGPVGIQAGGLSGIFPNLWITPNQLWLRLPKGPTVTELWSFLLLDPDLGPAERRAAIIGAQHGFGPAGFWEQDDGENWGQSTRGMAGNVSQRFPLHYGMQVGRGQVVIEENETPYIESGISEHAQLWYYRSWSEWMSSTSWEHLKLNHSIPEGVI